LLGQTERVWQDADYILGYFAKHKGVARKEYESFVAEGLPHGREKELAGGGLIRSLGGWAEAKDTLKGRASKHVMSDERILGDSDFVDTVLKKCDEEYERRYELKRQGLDLNRTAQRVAEIFGMEFDEVFSKGRQDKKVKARSLLCYWASNELGIPHTELAKKLEMSSAGITFSVVRGESIAKSNNYSLIG
jgi:hypothetical protein